MPAPPNCPHCNEALSPNARGCGCGASEANHWAGPHACDGLDLPDEDFDYDAFLEDEFGSSQPGMRRPSIGWGWWAVAVLLLIAFLMTVLSGLF